MKTPLIIAHRGASHDAPENTMASVHMSWQQDTDALEVDVHQTKDNKIVIIHDPDTFRTTGIKKIIKNENSNVIRQLDAGLWKGPKWKNEAIPFLKEVIKTVPAGKKIFIEIKGGKECIEPVKKIVDQSQLLAQQVIIMDFDLSVLKKARNTFPEYELLWLYEFIPPLNEESAESILNSIIEKAFKAAMDGINIELNPFITPALIKRSHERGLKFYAWTVNDIKTAKYLEAAGIDGLTTNKPALLKGKL